MTKLRNKKTGEIREAEAREDGIYMYDETTGQWYKYELPLLAEYWEYYKESKDDAMRVIDSFIQYVEEADDSFCCDESMQKFIEKLKAWERLKDKGFRFTDVEAGCRKIDFKMDASYYFVPECVQDDLDLLFGGEE